MNRDMKDAIRFLVGYYRYTADSPGYMVCPLLLPEYINHITRRQPDPMVGATVGKCHICKGAIIIKPDVQEILDYTRPIGAIVPTCAYCAAGAHSEKERVNVK